MLAAFCKSVTIQPCDVEVRHTDVARGIDQTVTFALRTEMMKPAESQSHARHFHSGFKKPCPSDHISALGGRSMAPSFADGSSINDCLNVLAWRSRCNTKTRRP
jgi:hypothetical protein